MFRLRVLVLINKITSSQMSFCTHLEVEIIELLHTPRTLGLTDVVVNSERARLMQDGTQGLLLKSDFSRCRKS